MDPKLEILSLVKWKAIFFLLNLPFSGVRLYNVGWRVRKDKGERDPVSWQESDIDVGDLQTHFESSPSF